MASALSAEVATFDTKLANDSRASVVAIRATLQNVRDALRDKQVENALRSYDAARLRYVVVLADDLRARVADNVLQPTGIEKTEWENLKRDTNARLDALGREPDADVAMGLLRDATREYVLRVAAALKRATAKLPAGNRTNIETALQPIEGLLDADDFTAAWKALDAAQAAFVSTVRALAGGQMGAEMSALAAAAGAPATGFDILSIFDLPPSWDSFGSAGSAARTKAAITLFDLLVSAIVLIAATLVGLQVLWIGNPTWGGGVSYLAAFLWGFAVDQFTHAGVSALAKKGS